MSMNKYHERFINSFASENIIGLFSRYSKAAKEITESWAMLEAARKYVENVSNRIVFVVGDGASPRTGALFAYFTTADVISLDPNFNMQHWEDHCKKQSGMGFPVRRLEVYKNKVEDFIGNDCFNCNQLDILVIWPHSHADMNTSFLENYRSRVDIAMPCCKPIPNNWMAKPHIVYNDYHVESPHRTVHIWK